MASASTYQTATQYPTMAPDVAFKQESTSGLPEDQPAPQQPHQTSQPQHAIRRIMPLMSPPAVSRRLLIPILSR